MTETENQAAAENASGVKKKKETAEQTISAKWGADVAGICKQKGTGVGGFIPVPRSFLRLYSRLGISPQAAMAALHIIDSKWDHRKPWATAETIARRMGKSTSQVKTYLAQLHKVGLKKTYDRKSRKYTFDCTEFFDKIATAALAHIAEEAQKKQREANDEF